MSAAPHRRKLVLIGFMGAGKTTVASELAHLLGEGLADADRVIEARTGSTIAELFDRDGEAAFRALEERVVLELLDGPAGVVGLGGGAVGSEAVRAALGAHTVVLCDVSLATAWERARRAGPSARPLARDPDAFAALYASRSATYAALADAVLPEASRERLSRSVLALDALRRAPAGTRLLWAAATSGDHPVWVRRGLLAEGAVDPWPAGGRRFCVSDETVAALHAGALGELAGLIELPPGERSKTLATCEAVWSALVAAGATRADHVVALGGGVVGDLAGFCAATYQRGIAVVQVPTTLVAQVDSAYGGKTGVDLPTAKNFVGAYHQPTAVLVDPALLATLPAAELAAGYAEVVKTALIAGGPLWERVRSGAAVDDEVVLGCARTKLGVVAEDERDGGRRNVLNLGHTVGHALETVTGYARLRHGEAVGLGLLAALRLSGQDALREEVAGLLGAVGLPLGIDGVDPAAVAEATRRDKKRRGEATPFVLVDAPGAVAHGRAVAPADLLAAIGELVTG